MHADSECRSLLDMLESRGSRRRRRAREYNFPSSHNNSNNQPHGLHVASKHITYSISNYEHTHSLILYVSYIARHTWVFVQLHIFFLRVLLLFCLFVCLLCVCVCVFLIHLVSFSFAATATVTEIYIMSPRKTYMHITRRNKASEKETESNMREPFGYRGCLGSVCVLLCVFHYYIYACFWTH